MNVPSIVQASREHKINQVMTQTGCSRDYAIAYLYAEEWFVAGAVMSYKADQKGTGQTA